jgi:hypothetical protein
MKPAAFVMIWMYLLVYIVNQSSMLPAIVTVLFATIVMLVLVFVTGVICSRPLMVVFVLVVRRTASMDPIVTRMQLVPLPQLLTWVVTELEVVGLEHVTFVVLLIFLLRLEPLPRRSYHRHQAAVELGLHPLRVFLLHLVVPLPRFEDVRLPYM